jgi:nicotinamidase/pyrazinamidase
VTDIAYDPTTALVVVDVQNDFADPAGSLYVRGGEDIVPRIDDEIARAQAAGAFVVYTADWHPETTPHFAKDGGVWPVHCVGETWGSRFHPALVVDGQVVRKGEDGHDGYSGFSTRHPSTDETKPTELAELLRGAGVTRIVVVGLATDYCVRSTALDGLTLGFEVLVPMGLVAAVNLIPGDGDRALGEVADAGATLVADASAA